MDAKTSISLQNLIHLPAFAAYLLAEKLEPFIARQLEYSFELNIPLLKYFLLMPEEERLALSRQSTTEMLTWLANNKAAEQIEDAMQQWRADLLPGISRDNVVAEDVTLINYARKKAMMEFVAGYATNTEKLLALINELDIFFIQSITAGTNQYLNLFRQRLNEHTHFISKVAETVPGAVYVFDVREYKGIYSNNKLGDIIGYDQSDLNALGENAIDALVHPDDREALREKLLSVRATDDAETNITKYRIKKPGGDYKWLANYESVFKRNDAGEVSQTIGITLDIDKEQRTMAELHQLTKRLALSDERHKQTEALAHIGTYAWNFVTDEIEWSDEMYSIFEVGKNENINYRFVVDAVVPEDKQMLDDVIKRSIKSGEPFDLYYRIKTRSGKKKILHSRGTVEDGENGKPQRVVGTDQDVTEKQELIRSLRKSQSLYKQAEEMAAMGNWSWDVKANKLEWTDQLYRIYGLLPQSETISIERFLSFIHSDDRPLVEEGIEKINRQESLDYTFRIILGDGTQKWLRSLAQVLKDENGKISYVIGTEQDVTEKQNLISKLEESQLLYKQAQHLARMGNFSWNIHTNEVFWSDEVYAIYEKPPGEKVKFEDAFEPVTSDYRVAVKKAIETAIAEKKGQRVSYAIRTQKGTQKFINLHTDVSLGIQNEVVSIIGTAQDVTEQHEALETIREQEYFIQQIADASPTILYMFNVPSQSMAYINREAFFVLGFSPEELLDAGDTVTSLLYHTDDMPLLPVRKESSRVFQQLDNMIQYECRMKHKDGSFCWMLVREIVFKTDEGGNILQVIGAALDISKRKEMEKTILHNTHQLEQSNASLEEFAYVASHDLKEPLRKISTFGDRLVASQIEKLDEEGKVYLRKIVDASQRMQNMISDLLSISMISGNRAFELTSLQKILDDVLQTLEFKIEQQRAIIKHDDLPEAHVIPSQFRQLFQNLIANSLKFVQDDVEPVIQIQAFHVKEKEVGSYQLAKAPSYLKIIFTDNGIGFEQEYAQKIFAIFQRLHGRSEYEGSGIGLAICKKIVEHHGGVIFATGRHGAGATFTIILPA